MHAEDDASLAFARRLAEALRRAGMSYAEVERRSGVKASTVADWVRKGSEPGTLSLARVADAVGTSIAALLGHEDRPPAGRTILSRGGIERILAAKTDKELRVALPISPACVVAFDVELGDEYASVEIRREYEKLVRDKIKSVSPALARELDAVTKKLAGLRDPGR